MALNSFCENLGINHPLEQSTCIGFAKRKPTCGCVVALASRQQACRLLEGIQYSIQQCQGVQETQLTEAARLLHCKRWHQEQAEEVVRGWSQIVSRLIRAKNEEKRTTRSMRSNADSINQRPRPKKVEIIVVSSSDPTNQTAYLIEVSTKMSKLMKTHCRRYDLDSDSTTFYFKDSMIGEGDTPRSLGMRKGDILEVCDDDFESDSGNSLDDNESSDGDSTDAAEGEDETEPEDEAQSTSEPARASHIECGICIDTYEDGQPEWECDTCQNRAHAACFDCWAKLRTNASAVATCPYCRA